MHIGQGSEVMIWSGSCVVLVCAVQPTEEMLEQASDKRDEAMTAVADGNILLLLQSVEVASASCMGSIIVITGSCVKCICQYSGYLGVILSFFRSLFAEVMTKSKDANPPTFDGIYMPRHLPTFQNLRQHTVVIIVYYALMAAHASD